MITVNEKGVTNALSFDVEEWFVNTNLEGQVQRSQWDNYESRIEKSTALILSLLEEKKVLATFFVLGWVAQRYPGLVKEIAKHGHEIATHGWSHKLIYNQNPGEFEDELKRSIELLEDLSGGKILGHRAACLSITAKSQWAIDILINNGIAYDSSIYPILHDRYGMVGAPRLPYILRKNGQKEIWEFPMATFRFSKLNIPMAGGGYFRLYPYMLTSFLMRRLNESGGPVMVYLHPPEFDPGQPRLKIGLKNKFRAYVGLENNFSKLKRLLEDFKFAPVRDVLKQFQA